MSAQKRIVSHSHGHSQEVGTVSLSNILLWLKSKLPNCKVVLMRTSFLKNCRIQTSCIIVKNVKRTRGNSLCYSTTSRRQVPFQLLSHAKKAISTFSGPNCTFGTSGQIRRELRNLFIWLLWVKLCGISLLSSSLLEGIFSKNRWCGSLLPKS